LTVKRGPVLAGMRFRAAAPTHNPAVPLNGSRLAVASLPLAGMTIAEGANGK
jgi:hypothetical protein